MPLFLRLTLILLGGFCLIVGAADPTPTRTLAVSTLEAQRDDIHRTQVRVIWGDDVESTPGEQLDVLLVRGYINREWLLFQWRQGVLNVHVAKIARSDYRRLIPKPLTLCRYQIDPAAFSTAWSALAQIFLARSELLAPQDPEEFIFPTGTMSSHAEYHLLTWRHDDGGDWSSLPVMRGTTSRNDIRDFGELQHEAVLDLLWPLLPAEPIAAVEVDEQSVWCAVLRTLVPGCHGDGVSELSPRSQLIGEDASAILAEIGTDDDGRDLARLAASLRPAQPPAADSSIAPTYWENKVRGAIANAQQRIALRWHWDSAAATNQLHQIATQWYAEIDQQRWLRNRFFTVDPEAYRALLLSDLHAADTNLVCASVGELATRYPGQHASDCRVLLSDADPDAVCASAMAILNKPLASYGWSPNPALADLTATAERDPLTFAALTALTRLAGDPSVPIPPAAYGFNPNARSCALDVLTGCPPPWHWDVARIQQQLENPQECDGRYIHVLLPHLVIWADNADLSGRRMPLPEHRALVINLWRRCLTPPLTRGTMIAIEELTALGDQDSLPRIREVLATLTAGCNHRLAHEADTVAPYPWTDRYQLEQLERTVATLAPVP